MGGCVVGCGVDEVVRWEVEGVWRVEVWRNEGGWLMEGKVLASFVGG